MNKVDLINKIKEAFNDFIGGELATFKMVKDELILIETKGVPNSLVLSSFIKSVLEIN